LKTHASDFLAYPLGGPNWASTGSLLLCLAGVWQLTRRRQWVFLGLIFAPASLHFLAAALQRYPYGGHVKFSQYLAPMICCLAAVGISQVLEWLSQVTVHGPGLAHFSGEKCADLNPHKPWTFFVPRKTVPVPLLQAVNGYLSQWRTSPRSGFACAVCLLVLVGCGSIVRDLACPYKTRSDYRGRAFAQSFWVGTHYAEEVACLKSDLGLDFVPEQHRELSWSAQFLCNRAIEMHRSSLRTADVSRVNATRPLRCVLYRDSRYPLDEAALEAWLEKMQQDYELAAHESVPFPRMDKKDRKILAMEYIDSYRFVPKPDSLKGLPPLAEGRQSTPH
jgi:hypothetical protein